MYHASILVEESLRSDSGVLTSPLRYVRKKVVTKMDKKWSCPACEYKSGRRSNIERHIDRKHGNYEVPVLTEFQHTGLPSSGFPGLQ